MSERVRIERSGAIAQVRLNRPDKLNALDLAMFEALAEAGRSLGKDRTLRAVVLSGEGRAFCSGLDFASFAAGGASTAAKLMQQYESGPTTRAQQAVWTWAELPVPVIAAVQGYAFGGGLQLALAADIRLIAEQTELCVMEIKYGLIPDMSGSQTLRRLVRADVASELVFTGRRVAAKEAVSLGLATRICSDPLQEATAMAEVIAQQSPDAIRAGKRLLREVGSMTQIQGLALEAELQTKLLSSKNYAEAVAASFTKRKPNFEDPQ